jgi:hypothetical protein
MGGDRRYAQRVLDSAWFPSLPSPSAGGFELLRDLLALLDRLSPTQLDPTRSRATWTKKGALNLLDVVLCHRTEDELTFSLALTDGGATLYYPHRTPEEFGQGTSDWPTELLVEVERQLRQSYVIEQTYWGSRHLKTVLRSTEWTSVRGLLSPLVQITPRRLLTVERRTADYGPQS